MNKPLGDEILCLADDDALPVNVKSGGWLQGKLLRMDELFCVGDCGFPLDSPSSSFAMPIRRVFGAAVFDLIERVPGDLRAGHFQARVHDPAGHFAHGPLARSMVVAAWR